MGPIPHAFTHSHGTYLLSESLRVRCLGWTMDRRLPFPPGAHILVGVSEKKTRCKPVYEIIEHYDRLCEEIAKGGDRE